MFFKSLILLLLIHCILGETDCDWVIMIYQQMGADISNINDCCSMDHIVCDEEFRVTQIVWDSTDLTGFLPTEIGNLINLKTL